MSSEATPSRFCEWCGVALDLHDADRPEDDRDELDCELAECKARLVDAFFSMGRAR